MPQAITVGRNTACVRTDRQTDGAQKATIILNTRKSHSGGNNMLGKKKMVFYSSALTCALSKAMWEPL